MTHKHFFEGSVCLGFKTFADASNQSGNRENKMKWPEDVSLLRYSGGDITALGTPIPRSQSPGESQTIEKHSPSFLHSVSHHCSEN